MMGISIAVVFSFQGYLNCKVGKVIAIVEEYFIPYKSALEIIQYPPAPVLSQKGV